MRRTRGGASGRAPYRSFGNAEWRNTIQAGLEVPTLVRLLDLPPGLDILEVGCGRGIGLTSLAATCRPRSLCGLDVDETLLAIAEARITQHGVEAQLIHGDIEAMPLASAAFDLVIDFGTCYHVVDQAAAISEVVRVLRPGGIFVHETLLSQLFAHPIRSRGNRLPWTAAPALTTSRHAGLWARRIKLAFPADYT